MLKLIPLYFVVKWREMVEWFRAVRRYYPKGFWKIDLLFKCHYLFNNPFKESKRFLKKRGVENIYSYGETPLTTMEKIASECNISSSDFVFDVGCGSGRAAMWLNYFVGCNVLGVDFVPAFIEKANQIAAKAKMKNISFTCKDFCEIDYEKATVIYFYGTGMEDSVVYNLIEKLKALPKKTRIITVSYPLTDYDPQSFKVLKTFEVKYTWGIASVYLQQTTSWALLRGL